MSTLGNRELSGTNSRAEDIAQHLSRGMQFVEELLKENERLRYKLLHASQEMAEMTDGTKEPELDPMEEVTRLKQLREMIHLQLDMLKSENDDFRMRYEELEKQNENFLNLFVSSCQIHSTLDEDNVLISMQEILLNLVGAEVFAIWMMDQEKKTFDMISLTDEADIFNSSCPELSVATVSKLASRQTSYFLYEGRDEKSPDDPLACIPLIMDDKTVGAVLIYKLLVQKDGFTSLDLELMELLATQAVTALVGARLYQRSGHTLEGLSRGREDGAACQADV